MTPNFLLLNASSLALICLLALFARHNKKIGWVKQRTTFVEDLRQLQKDWDESDQRVVPIAQRAASVAEFSTQLSQLRTALGQPAAVPVVETETVTQ